MTRLPAPVRAALGGTAGAVLALTGITAGAGAAVAAPALPDLVVTAAGPASGSAVDGSQVTFSATVKNVGTGAKEFGSTVGVAFVVDGRVVSWSDDDVSSVAPGESVTVTANAGPAGAAWWKATAGRHTVRAWVDDVNRIAESVETNNTRDIAFDVAVPGVKPVTGVKARTATNPAAYPVTHDDSVTVSWKVPAGQPRGTIYRVVEHSLAGDSLCAPGGDVERATVKGSSVTLQQVTGSTCYGHGSRNDSTFSVVSLAPGTGAAESAPSGACSSVAGYQHYTGAPGMVQSWYVECADGGSLSDAVLLGASVASVDAGGPGDSGYTGGQAYVAPASVVSDPVLRSTRWGWSRYEVPVPEAGTYEVTLSVVEPTWSAPGQRVFGLAAEGTTVRARLDPLREFAGARYGTVQAVVTVTDGRLTLDATAIVDNPIVSRIDVTKVSRQA